MRTFFLAAILLCSATLVQAEELDLSPYKGKVVYVDIWASWCPPCLASFPWMEKMHRDLSDRGLVILAVNTGETIDNAARFLEKTQPSFTIIEDPESDVATQLNALGMPYSFLFDRQGQLVSSHQGFRKKDAEALRQIIEKQLQEKTP